MTAGQMLTAIHENSDALYRAGRQAGQAQGLEQARRAFWEANQEQGKRTNYDSAYMGYGFSFENFYPIYDIRPQYSAANMFAGWNRTAAHGGSLKERLEACGVVLDTAQTANMTQAFFRSRFTELPAITLPGSGMTTQVFAQNPKLVTIDQVNVKADTIYKGCFEGCNSLENVRFSGEIGGEGLDFTYCPKLSLESLESILSCLIDYSGTPVMPTLILGPYNLAKLTSQQVESIQARNWRVI